jgi:hypothetical protein
LPSNFTDSPATFVAKETVDTFGWMSRVTVVTNPVGSFTFRISRYATSVPA